ncbi:hypothetical protein HMPREF1624_00544 [Sporothrix schenckii ATCC 58251]|uniref:Uncharacterized protein n=1 Tax=Sporothrix schenckii (strain ATCC 58251 / de Perez 2211183) TaxID=1391915 RepID=U7Q690_SPOS1|nr:hypothetical protein HMPREF1624_00544 [Sporothrix schenckii ATCC 58251]
MVVPSNVPAIVIPTASARNDTSVSVSASVSTSASTPPNSTSSFPSSSSSSPSSSNTGTSSISNSSSIEPGFVSRPTLQTSTVLGLVEDKNENNVNTAAFRRNEKPVPTDKVSPGSRPPSPGIDGKRECPYVNRPLPLPPPPKTPSSSANTAAANMTSRPNKTGGGNALNRPGPPAFSGSLAPPSRPDFNRRISRDDMFLGSQSKKSAAAFDRRISRDDLYLGTRPPAARSGAFHIPNRQQPSTVAELGGLDPPGAWPTRRASPESLMSGEIQIGMALGSPVNASPAEPITSFRPPQRAQADRLQRTDPATYASWQPREMAQTYDSLAAASESSSTGGNGDNIPIQRSKTTRRKLFGIFGSKRHHDPVKSTLTSTASSQSLEASDASSLVMTSAVPTSTNALPASMATERPGTRSGSKKHQPIIVQIVPEPATITNIQASNGSSPGPASFGVPAATATAAPSNKDGRGKRPFLRSKASEPAFRKASDVSNRMPMGLGNNTMANLTAASGYPPAGDSKYLMPPPMLGASPYLDVEIPEARLERYSVMFGNLLGSGPSWQPASSLLARRQATLDKLKNINDRIRQEDFERDFAAAAAADATMAINGLPSPGLQRRATSPHVTRSPAFSLFPGRPHNTDNNNTPGPALTNTTNVNSPLLSPRLRSNTTPATTRSPTRAGFHFQQPPGVAVSTSQKTAQPLSVSASQRYNKSPLRSDINGHSNPSSMLNRRGPPTKTQVMPTSVPAPAPAPVSVVHFDPTESRLILDSPTEMDYPVEQTLQPFKPVIEEPRWQMISPPSSIGSVSSSSAGSAGSATSKLLRSRTSGSPASTTSLELDVEEPDPTLKSAVEISIARQISVSRQQRQLLRPLKTNNLAVPAAQTTTTSTTPMSSSSSPSRSATLRLGRNERLQETKMSTPTLVVAPTSLDNTNVNNYKYVGENDSNGSRGWATSSASSSQQQQQQQQQQQMRYLSPRNNASANSNMQAYQLAQNRKSERVILEAV